MVNQELVKLEGRHLYFLAKGERVTPHPCLTTFYMVMTTGSVSLVFVPLKRAVAVIFSWRSLRTMMKLA